LEDLLDVDGMLILQRFLKKFSGRCGLELCGSRQGQVSGRLVQDEEIPRSKTCGEFDWVMNDDRLKNCGSWS
jgi:hypothetical protein